MTVAIEVFAGVDPVNIGPLVSINTQLLPTALLAAAPDPYAAAAILAPRLIAKWNATLVVDVTADNVAMEDILDILSGRGTPLPWVLTCDSLVDVSFAAEVTNAYALSDTGDVVRYSIDLTVETTATIAGGDIVTTMLDLRDPDNLINAMTFGGL